MKTSTRFLSLLLSIIMILSILPVSSLAAETDSGNNIAGPVEEWNYVPSSETSESSDEVPRLFSAFSADNAPLTASADFSPALQATSAAEVVNVHVTATDKSTNAAVPVEGAQVHLYVGSEWKRDGNALTDSNGDTTISLEGLSEKEKHNATLSAHKVVSRGKAIDGTARDALFQNFPKDEYGDYYRYTMELHSETIDENGNWNGAELPSPTATGKVDIVFAIDATGSMGDEINNVRTNIADFSQHLVNQGLDIRFCIIDYRDITEGESTNMHTVSGSHWLTSMDAVISELASITVSGGGDTNETPIDALGMIADDSQMFWRSDAHKFAFVLTDAGYKTNNGYGYTDMAAISNALASMNVITSVITSSSYSSTYSTLYSTTNGIYANINASNFNAEMITLADSIVDTVERKMTLKLSEPRMLVNMSVCYFADDATSQSESYRSSVKNMLNEYSNRLAETSDGHVLIDKILLFSTSNRLNFYNIDQKPSMADIRIETKEKDGEILPFDLVWKNVTVHSNAYPAGFYSDDTYTTDFNQTDDNGKKINEHFKNLDNTDLYDGRQSFYRIQMSGVEGAGWNNSMIDDAHQYSTTVAHETGHYLFGFLDEYLNAKGKEWGLFAKPYSAYGLMDNHHSDIEMSKASIDYSYIGNFDTAEESKHTWHSRLYKASCEDTLANLLTEPNEDTVLDRILDSTYNVGNYKATYTKASGKDRTASYGFAGLSDDDYLSISTSSGGILLSSDKAAVPSTVSTTYFDDFTATGDSLGAAEMKGNGNTVSFSVTPLSDYDYSLFILKSGNEEYSSVTLTEDAGKYVAELPIALGELAEIRLVAEKDGTSSYNTYFVDCSESVADGYIYSSADGKVIAYVTSDDTSSYTFVADNTGYANGDYTSVNQATVISSDNGVTLTGGEIYSVASYMAEIDYTTLSWFKYECGVWTQLATDYSEEENMNIGARADLDGEGLYVLMAKPAPVGTVSPAENLSFTQSADRDAVVTLSFDDGNATSKYYNVYYSENEFTDKNDEDVIVRSFPAGSTDLTLDLYERGRAVNAAIEIVLEDGSRSALSAMINLEAGTADSDGDGIPDWYCDQYLLWPEGGESKDIANSDDDGDGLTNLQEYQGGSDPTDPNDPIHTTNIPVEDVAISPNKVNIGVGATETLTAVIAPSNATNKNIVWYVSDNSVLSITPNKLTAEITALSEGTATVMVTTADGGYVATCVVTCSVMDTYNITIQTDGHGTAASSKTTAAKDEIITLSAFPYEGYEFDKWEIVSGEFEITDNSFIMPEENITICATFKAEDTPEPESECKYNKTVKLAEGTFGMKLSGKDKGEFTFAQFDGGWSINNGENYLTMKDGKLVLSDEAFEWTYKNGAFSTSVRTQQKSNGHWFLFFYIPGGNKTVTTTYYLSTVTGNEKLSTKSVSTELYKTVTGEHKFGVWIDCKDGVNHKHICANCGEVETEAHHYGADDKCIECGAFDPSKADVKISVDVKEKTTKQFAGFLFWGTWKNVTTYTATIKTEASGVKVTKVQYQLNRSSKWITGTCVSSDKPIESLKVKAWDNTGKVHEYTYIKGN